MPQFKRVPSKFVCTGVDLRHPPDLMPQGKYPILQNVRVNQQGALTVRQTLNNVSGSAVDQLDVHSIRRLNNFLTLFPAGGAPLLPYTRVVGSGSKLYSGPTNITQIDTGYSGDPLSLVPCQPLGGQDGWMYVGDKNKMRKVRGDAAQTNYQAGISPPTQPPTATYNGPVYAGIATGAGAFTPTGTAGAVTTPNRFSTTIAVILYDSGSTGYACVAPTAMGSALQPGCLINVKATEYVLVREVFEAIETTTIASILYDAGATGLCTIKLTANSSGLRPNALIQLGGAEYVRVLSVTTGDDPNFTSFRCSTTGTRSSGDAVTGQRSYRAFYAGTYAGGDSLVSPCNSSTISTGVGILTLAGALNLGSILNRPVERDDYIHISVYVDNPDNVVEGKFLLDTDPSVNDFAHNYLYKAFRADDLQTNVSGILTVPTAQQVAVQRQILGDNTLSPPIDPSPVAPDLAPVAAPFVPTDAGQGLSTDGEAVPSSLQQSTGSGQWSELLIKVSELVRVGSDRSRWLQNVASIRVQLQVTAATVIQFGSWWIGGTYGKDVGQTGSPVLYAYRYRSSVTGAVSNPSPVMRSGLTPLREGIIVSYTASSDPQVDQIEIFAFGAGVDSWRKILQVPNANSSAIDSFSALDTATNPTLPFDNFVPFPTTDIPRAGTCNVFGTAIQWVTGDTFNVNWAPGSLIVVNNVTTVIYSVVSSTILMLQDSVGSAASANFSLPGPTIQAQPLPFVWGPFGGTDTGLFLFGVGDPNDPGLLYWTNPNDPDSVSDKNFISVTSPSEPLMNGFTVDGNNILFSSERVFSIFQSLSGVNKFTTQELINGSGLFSPWAFCFKGSKFWYLSKSGIYEASISGGSAQPITDEDLYPLFPHEGAPAPATDSINGAYLPPDLTVTNKLRLAATEDSVYFFYQDTAGVQRTMRYDLALKGWFPEDFTPAPAIIYKEEGEGVESTLAGGEDGIVYDLVQGTGDGDPSVGLIAVSCRVRTQAIDNGDSRSRKYFGDVMFDVAGEGVGISVTPFFDNFERSPDPPTVVTTFPRSQAIIDLASGAGIFGRNIGLDIQWSSSVANPALYEWQPAFVDKPELSLRRATDWDDAGTPGDKYFRAVLIEADTLGVNRSIAVLKDNLADSGNLLTVTDSTQSLKSYPLTPFTSHLVKLAPQDSVDWQLFRAVWIFDPYPEMAAITGKWTDGGYPGDKWVQGVRLKADTSGLPVNLQIQGDGESLQTTITGAVHSGQQIKPYSWTPFIAHLLRIVPLGPARIWEDADTDWIFEPLPELTDHWETETTTNDLTGFEHARDHYIAMISQGDVRLVVTADGKTATFAIPNTNNSYSKIYVKDMLLIGGSTWPLKGKSWSYALTGGPFRLFKKDCEFRIKSWSDQRYSLKRPFGDTSNLSGARI